MKERKNTGLAVQKQFLVAGCLVLILLACLMGIYLAGNVKKEDGDAQLAEEESVQELQEVAQAEVSEPEEPDADEVEEQKTQTVDTVIRAEEQETPTIQPKNDSVTTPETEQKTQAQTASVGGSAVVAVPTLSFSGELAWPLEGSVLMNYSMDQSIYFATLDQYKRNPAMIIAAGEGTDVAAAAAGTITEISTDAQTGQTVRMDIGDGYTLIYGQLQDLKYNEGAHLDAGDVMGTVAAATKYYSVEGNNLYFAMEKDGSPVDPTEYLPQ